jgi:hypothetical protein
VTKKMPGTGQRAMRGGVSVRGSSGKLGPGFSQAKAALGTGFTVRTMPGTLHRASWLDFFRSWAVSLAYGAP